MVPYFLHTNTSMVTTVYFFYLGVKNVFFLPFISCTTYFLRIVRLREVRCAVNAIMHALICLYHPFGYKDSPLVIRLLRNLSSHINT